MGEVGGSLNLESSTSTYANAYGANAPGQIYPLGVAVLSTKQEMKITKPKQFYAVKVIAGKKEREGQIDDSALAFGKPSKGYIKYGKWICAELHAAQFEILKGIEKRQCEASGDSPQVSFDWEVSPLSEGNHIVAATVQSFLEKNGALSDQIDSNTLTVAVTADSVTWWERQLDNVKRIIDKLIELAGSLRNLLLVFAAIIAAISLIIWRLKGLGKKPEEKAQASGTTGATAP